MITSTKTDSHEMESKMNKLTAKIEEIEQLLGHVIQQKENNKMKDEDKRDQSFLDKTNNLDFITSLKNFEMKILETDSGYLPNPSLTVMKCCFRYTRCKKTPEYTDGNNNYYCWTHSIMIQVDKYK